MQTTRSTTKAPRYAVVDAPRAVRRLPPKTRFDSGPLRAGILTVLYLLLGQLGARFVLTGGPISSFWPASGLAFAFVALYGRRAWPGILIGSGVTSLLNGAPLWAAILVGLGSSASTLAAITMARRFCGFRAALRTVPDAVGLAIPGAALGSCIAAIIGTSAYFAAGMVHRDQFANGLLAWWVGDALGVVLVAPVLLTFADRKETMSGSLPELLLLTLVAPGVTYAAFMDRPLGYPFSFIVFPLVVWAALRFGVRGAASANLVVGLIALLMTRAGRGEFANQPLHPLVGAGLFVLVLATTGLFLACAISQATAAQAELHQSEVRHREQLERRVVERTAELSTLNAELESFSYSVAHDLRGPLRTIAGFSRMVLDDEAPRLSLEARDLLERSERAAIRMGRIVDALLGLSRINRGEIHFEGFDISKLAVETSREVSSQTDATIEWTIEPGLRTHADPRLVRVLLTNLFENAAKFTRGRPIPRIEFGRTERDGESYFFVSDNGVGFDQTFSKKLFKPFHRLHGNGEFEGEGIGLATVERIVRRHGGRILAEGAEDQGAVFFFTLSSVLRPEKPWSPVEHPLL